ncbi:MAG: ABC transporter permease subunit [Planctomycetes bacterium]|jgi:ABC-type sugar transport system permease subunit|nr:ABC transporter permease subunit [Planctomycetota bacterium]
MFYRLQQRYAPYLFVSPFIVLFCVFMLYPLVKSVILSFYITAGPRAQVFVGLDNFAFLLRDPDFHKAALNTLIFTLASLLVQLPLSLGAAMLLNSKAVRGRNFFRFAFFSPHLMGTVFAAILFTLVLAPRFGILNKGLVALVEHTGPLGDAIQWLVQLTFGVEITLETRWLQEPVLVLPAIILVSLWLYIGFNMIYFLAALQSVDQDLYEAAHVDGASPWQRFLHVTLPGIKPVTVFVVVMSTIGSFKMFELAYLLLGGGTGPDQAGLFIVTYLYQSGFEVGDLGYASAIGWTLTIAVLIVALLQIKFSGTLKKE